MARIISCLWTQPDWQDNATEHIFQGGFDKAVINWHWMTVILFLKGRSGFGGILDQPYGCDVKYPISDWLEMNGGCQIQPIIIQKMLLSAGEAFGPALSNHSLALNSPPSVTSVDPALRGTQPTLTT